jgi:pimeloyl-ACP methyl ester carboxylesterase
MEFIARDIPVYYDERGDGMPVLALHGGGVDHREMVGALEPVFAAASGHRRIYPDQPGVGRTPAPQSLVSADDELEVLLAFVDGVIGAEPFLLVGHSAGAYMARAIAARRPGQIAGLALLCPLGERFDDVPAYEVLLASVDPADTLAEAEAGEYRDYFVVQTADTLERFTRHVAPGMRTVDEEAMARMGERWMFAESPDSAAPYPRPVLIVAGRQDSTVGYADAWRLLEHYPRATFAVLDRAGHALPHEQPGVLGALLTEWLDRVREQHP